MLSKVSKYTSIVLGIFICGALIHMIFVNEYQLSSTQKMTEQEYSYKVLELKMLIGHEENKCEIEQLKAKIENKTLIFPCTSLADQYKVSLRDMIKHKNYYTGWIRHE